MRLDHLPLFSKARKLHAVIETPRGSRNKYAYDPQLKAITLSKVLPEGMAFPVEFGFFPQTLGEDGDPLDVLVLMDAEAVSGCVVEGRLIGVMEAKQLEGKKRIRNDRFLVVAEPSIEFAGIHRCRDLPPHIMDQLAQFFVNYHKALGTAFFPQGTAGPKRARKLIEMGRVDSD
ncbi:MAG: Inorganic pyrophosphatase [Lacunisphaera sp.]|nr:Inorganic pyrophosphatase [Lacunisphaera sp.]